MSNFRRAQNEAHPNKTNTILTGIILTQIMCVGMQIWFLFGALNNALEGNVYFALTTFVGSAMMAVAAIWLLKYLPDPLKNRPKKKQVSDDSR